MNMRRFESALGAILASRRGEPGGWRELSDSKEMQLGGVATASSDDPAELSFAAVGAVGSGPDGPPIDFSRSII